MKFEEQTVKIIKKNNKNYLTSINIFKPKSLSNRGNLMKLFVEPGKCLKHYGELGYKQDAGLEHMMGIESH